MNPTKWKSVVVSIDAYKALKSLAVANHRTISGQLTHILEVYMRRGLDKDDDETRTLR